MGNALRATWHTSRGRVAAIQHVRRAASKAHDVAKAAKLRQSICAGIALVWRDGAEIQAAARRLASWSQGRRGQWQHFPRSLSSLGVISAARLASARGPTFLRMDNAPLQGSSPESGGFTRSSPPKEFLENVVFLGGVVEGPADVIGVNSGRGTGSACMRPLRSCDCRTEPCSGLERQAMRNAMRARASLLSPGTPMVRWTRSVWPCHYGSGK